MRRIPAPLLLLAALGLVLALPGGANACCLHGLLRCEVCGGGQGYYVGGTLPPQPGPPTPPPQPGPSQPGGGGAPPFPSLAPSLLYPARPRVTATATARRRPPTVTTTATARRHPPTVTATATARRRLLRLQLRLQCGGAPLRLQLRRGGASERIQLRCAHPASSALADAPFERSTVGSYIFHFLGQYGRGLSKSGLLEKAVEAFLNVNGFMPTPDERQILEDIVARFLGEAVMAPLNPGRWPGTAGTGPLMSSGSS